MLRRGSRGEEVEALQRRLLAKGFNPGPTDGVFGPKTEGAVKRFQERHGLQVDGIVGPKTMAAFETPASAPGPAPAPAAPESGGNAEKAAPNAPKGPTPA